MKTILVDAIDVLIVDENKINQNLYNLLESYPNPKIIVTGATEEQVLRHGLDHAPYTVFNCAHNPEKSEPDYFKILMREHSLAAEDLIYFDHSEAALRSAQSVGVTTYFYNAATKDMLELKSFLDANCKEY